MLDRVQISNFSLLREVDLPLSGGLTCISGESGAGKSLLFDAIAFACGGRVHRSFIPEGGSSCSVTLSLRLAAATAQALGPGWRTGGNELNRRYGAGGRAVSILNGEQIRVADVQASAARLVEITGQFESTTLFNPSAHVTLLDAFGGAALGSALEGYRSQYEHVQELTRRLTTLRSAEAGRQEEIAALAFQVDELDKAAVREGEREEAASRLRLQQHGEAVLQAAATAGALLTGSEDAPCAYDLTAQAQRELRQMADRLGPTEGLRGDPGAAAALLAQCLELIQESAGLCRELTDSVAFDAAEATRLTQRVDELLRLERKYGVPADGLPGLLAQKQERLAILTDERSSPEDVAEKLAQMEQELLTWGARLTELREKASRTMRKEAVRFFGQLDFPRCELQVELTPARTPGPLGLEDVELLITLNPGEPPRPLVQVASGGEASRLLLGLKAALADKLGYGILLLDEIEAGLGGRAAHHVADVMLQLARGRQVLAITHLPAVAARADHHLIVRKTVRAGRTAVTIAQASTEEQRAELGRMLGGLGTAEERAVVEQLLAPVAP